MMMILPFLAAAAAAASSPTAPMEPASLAAANATRSIFESDWVLMTWALKGYDRNHDVMLSPDEIAAAASEFRSIADSDGDGRISPFEYSKAREFILARY